MFFSLLTFTVFYFDEKSTVILIFVPLYAMRYLSLTDFKIFGRNITNLRYADDTTLMVEREEELKPLDESGRGE